MEKKIENEMEAGVGTSDGESSLQLWQLEAKSRQAEFSKGFTVGSL